MMTIDAINSKLEKSGITTTESRPNEDGTFTITSESPIEDLVEAIESGKMNKHVVIVHARRDDMTVFSLETPASKYSRTGKPNSSVKGNLKPHTWFSEPQQFIKGTLKGILKKHVDANDYESIIDAEDDDLIVDTLSDILGNTFYYEEDGYLGTGLYEI